MHVRINCLLPSLASCLMHATLPCPHWLLQHYCAPLSHCEMLALFFQILWLWPPIPNKIGGLQSAGPWQRQWQRLFRLQQTGWRERTCDRDWHDGGAGDERNLSALCWNCGLWISCVSIKLPSLPGRSVSPVCRVPPEDVWLQGSQCVFRPGLHGEAQRGGNTR